MIVNADDLSSVTLDSLETSRWSPLLADRPGPSFRGGVQHQTQSHHTWNVTQPQLKVDWFVPLDRAAVQDSFLWTVDAGAEVLTAVVQRCSHVHLQHHN